MKHKFKVGDLVRVASFPARMYLGNDPHIRSLYETKKVLKVKLVRFEASIRSAEDVESCHFYDEGWYIDCSSLELVKAAFVPKRIQSWKLCAKYGV